MPTGNVARAHPASATISAPIEPARRAILAAIAIAVVFVALTRWPVARKQPFEPDEFGFVSQVAVEWFPMHHTLFLTSARVMGAVLGDAYRGFVVLDMLTSAGALLCVWWMLRAIVQPATAAAGALALGVAPVFWSYGAMASNYTAIVLVGAFLLGIVFRGAGAAGPKAWHATAAATVFAIGTGYRQDIGTLWLAVFGVILWQNGWKRAIGAGLLFTAINLLWLSAMLHEAGGWSRYRALSAEYAYQCGYLNSVWNLGLVDAPLRYAVKLGMALLWTLGPALLFVPRGAVRMGRLEHGGVFGLAIMLAAVPAIGSHLLVQFGSAGWSFHYVPSLVALAALGVDRAGAGVAAAGRSVIRSIPLAAGLEPGAVRLLAIATVLAALFLGYPTDYEQPGWRGDFELSFCRFTRVGLRTPFPDRAPAAWRTANSRPFTGLPARRREDKRSGSG